MMLMMIYYDDDNYNQKKCVSLTSAQGEKNHVEMRTAVLQTKKE